MAVLIASICTTLIILAFCQIIVETILPEGGTKRYVLFLAGLVAVFVIVSSFTASGADVMKAIYTKTAEMKNETERYRQQSGSSTQTSSYQDYIEKLIEAYR